MKQFFARVIRRRLLYMIVITLLIIGFLYMYQTTQTNTPTTSIANRLSTKVFLPISRSRTVNMTFLGSRPFLIHLLTDDIVSDRIAGSRAWMPHQTKFISLLLANASAKPAVFLDIGANIGWFTLVMAALGHKVIAIEPMQTNVNLMQASLQISQLSENVIVHTQGLSTTPGECILYSDDRNIGDGHMVCGLSGERDINGRVPAGYSIRQVIRSTRLDALVKQDIDVMKIDVEGSELHAVRSGIRLFEQYRIRHVISEFSPRMMREKNTDPYEYLQFFVSHGYHIRMVTDNLSSLYERNAWETVPIYRSEQDLRQLCTRSGELELWFTKD